MPCISASRGELICLKGKFFINITHAYVKQILPGWQRLKLHCATTASAKVGPTGQQTGNDESIDFIA